MGHGAEGERYGGRERMKMNQRKKAGDGAEQDGRCEARQGPLFDGQREEAGAPPAMDNGEQRQRQGKAQLEGALRNDHAVDDVLPLDHPAPNVGVRRKHRRLKRRGRGGDLRKEFKKTQAAVEAEQKRRHDAEVAGRQDGTKEHVQRRHKEKAGEKARYRKGREEGNSRADQQG